MFDPCQSGALIEWKVRLECVPGLLVGTSHFVRCSDLIAILEALGANMRRTLLFPV
jgi:hypothetical protein